MNVSENSPYRFEKVQIKEKKNLILNLFDKLSQNIR